MRYLYSVLFYLVLPFLFIRLFWRSRRNSEYRRCLGERLGYCPSFKHCLWLHAVSVGETIAAVPLIKALREKYPDVPFVVTNMTPTGALRVKAAFGDTVTQLYIPYDVPGAVSRFLKRIRPKVAIIMETELWPNLFAACKEQGVPIVIANARLSAKSALGYERIQPMARHMLKEVSALASQGKADAERLVALGLPREKLTVTGNIKFDIELPPHLQEKAKALRDEWRSKTFIWVAASTHPTEEEIILKVHRAILKKFSGALLILVPRHPDRFDGIADLVKQEGFCLARRSLKENIDTLTQVYLSDTMGELLLMYAVSDVAFVAGSFAPVGGHNMLEAAVLEKPIIMGPQLFNFTEISEMLLSQQGMIKVEDVDAFTHTLTQLADDPAERTRIGQNAFRVVEANRGALKKQLDIIESVIR